MSLSSKRFFSVKYFYLKGPSPKVVSGTQNSFISLILIWLDAYKFIGSGLHVS